MCFSYSVNANQQSLPFDIDKINIPKPGFFFSGFQHPILPICNRNFEWENAHWGLIPKWAKGQQEQEDIQNKTLNARIETVNERASFKTAWEKNPCIVACSGFFEWKQEGNTKIPHYIFPKSDEWLFFGGIYEDYIDANTCEWHRSYSILTTQANTLMAEIHNVKKRMPVIVEREHLETWLSGNTNERFELCRPLTDGLLDCYPVSKNLNSNRLDRNQEWAIKEEKPPENWTLF